MILFACCRQSIVRSVVVRSVGQNGLDAIETWADQSILSADGSRTGLGNSVQSPNRKLWLSMYDFKSSICLFTSDQFDHWDAPREQTDAETRCMPAIKKSIIVRKRSETRSETVKNRERSKLFIFVSFASGRQMWLRRQSMTETSQTKPAGQYWVLSPLFPR